MIYSYSRLNSFKECPRFFRYRYVDKIPADDFETVERYLGTCVHDSLETLYKRLIAGDNMTCDELLTEFDDVWAEGSTDSIIINQPDMSLSDYHLLGNQCITSYYFRHAPFETEKVMACEMRVNIDLLGDGRYKFIGFIDRLDRVGNGSYQIHDYKTGSKPLSQAKADKDLQLALYELGIRQKIGHVTDVDYVWHFLRHDRRVRSNRTAHQLSEMKKGLVSDIHMIDEAIVEDRFPNNRNHRCRWCEYQHLCLEEEGKPILRQTRLPS